MRIMRTPHMAKEVTLSHISCMRFWSILQANISIEQQKYIHRLRNPNPYIVHFIVFYCRNRRSYIYERENAMENIALCNLFEPQKKQNKNVLKSGIQSNWHQYVMEPNFPAYFAIFCSEQFFSRIFNRLKANQIEAIKVCIKIIILIEQTITCVIFLYI